MAAECSVQGNGEETNALNDMVFDNVQHTSQNLIQPKGISLRVDDRDVVEQLFSRAQAAGAQVLMPLTDSRIAYSFTLVDADGNQWWVNAETGFLDELRGGQTGE